MLVAADRLSRLSGFRYLLYRELEPLLCVAVVYPCPSLLLREQLLSPVRVKYYVSPLLVGWRCIVPVLFDCHRFNQAENDSKRQSKWLKKTTLIPIKYFVCGDEPVGLLWVAWTDWKLLRCKLVVPTTCLASALQQNSGKAEMHNRRVAFLSILV